VTFFDTTGSRAKGYRERVDASCRRNDDEPFSRPILHPPVSSRLAIAPPPPPPSPTREWSVSTAIGLQNSILSRSSPDPPSSISSISLDILEQVLTIASSAQQSMMASFPSTTNAGMPAPSYIVYRDIPAGQSYDPTAPPVFFPPKDSDELFDALRAKYPHVKSHSERMRDAMIEFLIQEREEQKVQQVPVTTASLSDSFTPTDMPSISPWLQSSRSNSAFSSPETLELSTPSFGMSPLTPHRSFSTAASTTVASPALVGPTPPAIERMTGVFSISTTEQPRQRIRRKMTEAEKIEYRMRRIVKACDKCSKRKRKCNHNKPEMEKLAPKQKAAKARASHPHPDAVAPVSNFPPDIQHQPDIVDFDSFMFDDPLLNTDSLLDNDRQLFDGLVDFPKEPQYNFDHAWQFDQLGMTSTCSRRISDEPQQQDFDHLVGFDDAVERMKHDGRGMEATTGGRNLQTPTSANNANTRQALAFNPLEAQLDHRAMYQTSWHSHEMFSTLHTGGHPQRVPEADRQHQQSGGDGQKMLWEHLRTGQIEPTHNAHVHDTEGAASYVFDSAGRSGSGSYGSRGGGGINAPAQSSWAQTVLRLTGTMKAIKAFGKLARRRESRSSLQSISIAKVALLVSLGAARAVAQQQHPGAVVDHTSIGQSPAPFKYNNVAAEVSRSCRGYGDSSGLQANGGLLGIEGNILPEPAADGRLESMTIDDYLCTKTNIWSESNNGDLGGMSAGVDPYESKSRKRTMALPKNKGSAFASALARPYRLLLESATPDQGWPVPPVFGERIDRAPEPAVEMFMLKRRLPKALHSVVDRSNRRRNVENEPLLQTETLRERELEVMLSHNPSDSDSTLGAAGTPHLRSDIDNHSRPDPSFPTLCFKFASAGDTAPVHTRPRSPSSSESSAGPFFLHHHLADAVHANPPSQTLSLVGRAGGHTDVAAAPSPRGEERLSDHLRRRDHFGRIWAPVLSGLLLLAAFLRRVHYAGSVDLVLLFLAVLSPMPSTQGEAVRARCRGFETVIYGTTLQCTEKNSSWLGAFGFPAAGDCSHFVGAESRRKEKKHANMFLGKGLCTQREEGRSGWGLWRCLEKGLASLW